MNIPSIQLNDLKTTFNQVDPSRSESVDSFASVLAQSGQTPEQRVRHAADQLIATTFIKPMLASVRQDPLRSDLFHGGSGEDLFAEHLDTELADRITARMRLGLGDSITRQMLRLPPQAPLGLTGATSGGINRYA